jgi:putative nucleotidyltransferase with HDIG domain
MYDLSINTASPIKIKAPSMIENVILTENNRIKAIEAANVMEPLLKMEPEIYDKVKANLDIFFEELDGYREQARQTRSIILDNEMPMESQRPVENSISVYLSENNRNIISNMDDSYYRSFKFNISNVLDKIFRQGIQNIDSKNLLFIKDEINKLSSVQADIDLYNDIVLNFIEPNIIVDEEATERAKEERRNNYEKVYFISGQTIIDEGQIITEDVYKVLSNLGFIKDNQQSNFISIIGISLLILIIFVYFYIYCCTNKLIKDRNQVLILFSLYLLVIVLIMFTMGFSYYYIPIQLFTLLIAVLINNKLALISNISVSLISLLIYKADIEFLFYSIMTGLTVLILSKFLNRRDKVIIVVFVVPITNMLLSLALSLYFDKSSFEYDFARLLYKVLNSGIVGLATVLLSVGSLPFWEAVFNVVTSIRLIELTNSNNELLRRLAIEAPGTYHHSLLVANLAEEAARTIGANSTMARAGAYYHDIGKLKCPIYFAENQAGKNIHDNIDPYESSKIIRDHVTYGIQLAKEYKIPKVIVDFIEQHHGTTITKYFYHKAKRNNADISEEDFRYAHRTPTTKETGIVMLADTVEPVVRLEINTGKSIDELAGNIDSLIKYKIDEAQLINSNLTLKDISLISKAFLQVFKGMYHDRVPYPEKN